MSSLSRRPFTAERLDAALDVCAAYPVAPFPTGLLRRLMTTLVTGPESVVELTRGGETVALAVAADGVHSAANCAVVDLLALKPGESVVEVMTRVLDAVEPWIACGPCVGLEVPVEPDHSALTATLIARGYRLAFTSYDMETPEIPAPSAPALPGPTWRWARSDPSVAEPYHRVVHAAFEGVPGAYLSTLPVFRETLATGEPDTLLYRDADLAGFICARLAKDGLGYIRLVGRAPRYRGQGLGPILLAQGMRELAARGARRFGLDVTASNVAALDLYLRYGFEIVRAVPVYRHTQGSPAR